MLIIGSQVNQYRQHWWKCNGPCQKRSPYFGMVKRAMNRAPSPRDGWWKEHQNTCGGSYVKIKEPDGYGADKKKKGKGGGNRDLKKMLKNGGGKSGGEFSGLKEPNREKLSSPWELFASQGQEDSNSERNKRLKAAEKRELENGVKGTANFPPYAINPRGFSGTKELDSSLDSTASITAFPGKGSVLSTQAPKLDISDNRRNKMLEAAEKRKMEYEKVLFASSSLCGVKRKRENAFLKCSDNTGTCIKKSSRQEELQCIPTDQESSNVDMEFPATSIHDNDALSLKDDSTRPDLLIPLDSCADDFKTCPLCGMSNIPSAIINIHVSLCLDMEDELQFVDDNDDNDVTVLHD